MTYLEFMDILEEAAWEIRQHRHAGDIVNPDDAIIERLKDMIQAEFTSHD